MDWAQGAPADALGYMRYFSAKMTRLRVPANGSLELTRRCNLRCVHCYARPQVHRGPAASAEMSTRQVCAIIDQIAAAGCLSVLLTGGEPLLRKDFPEIYRHAIHQGLLVTVFTNATLVTDEVVALFQDLPPQRVEVSLYGATAATCAAVTGVGNSLERCRAGIERLLAGGIRVGLKTVLLKCNVHEFDAIAAIAKAYGVNFRLDAGLFPRFDGDRTPLDYRVDPATAVACEFTDPERVRSIRDYYDRYRNLPAAESLYECGAGRTHFNIDPQGTLQPCLMTPEPAYSLVDGSFEQGWREMVPRVTEIRASADNGCRACGKRSICGYCPSFFLRENGHAERPSTYLCEVGHRRHEALMTPAGIES